MSLSISKIAILVCMLLGMSVPVVSKDVTDGVGTPVSRYTVYLGGRPAFIQDYQAAVLSEILSHSGVSELQIERTEVTSLRAEMLVAEEKTFDLSISTIPEHKKVKGLTRISVPIHNGLMGLRHLIVHKDNLEDLVSNMNAGEFSRFSVAQGSSWSEIKIYQHAQIPVIGSHEFTRLFELVKTKRVDYLPLGVIEARRALDAFGQNYRELDIAKNVYILYAMPGYIVVSDKRTALAEKVRVGSEKIQKSGRLTSLFNQYFSKQLNTIVASNSTLIILDNPLLAKKENDRIIQSVINQYFNSHTRKFYFPHATNSQTSKANVNN